ncbi:MAG: tetratricopeptide repeat protein [Magnetococcales bacterium]|nr:tetratricopeptide repeat protein [Magnetococcales bacterium]NGZ25277.1 tetratricopeptide repeat protein [Magnetococcales bacterium]
MAVKPVGDAALQQAISALQQGDFSTAERLLLPLSRKGTLRGAACYQLAVLFHRRGDNEQALTFMQEAVTLAPGEAVYQRDLGVILKQLGLLEQAIAAYQQALALQPAMVEARCNLGEALRVAGHQQEAIAQLSQAVVEAPFLPLAHYNLGVAQWDAGDARGAAASFQRLLELEPNHFAGHLNRGAACQALDQLAQAIEHYQMARSLQPNHPDAGRNLAHALLLSGQVEEAIQLYQAILARHPNDVATAVHLLTAQLYQPGLDNATLFQHHRRFARRYARPPVMAFRPTWQPGERLRLGYICSHWTHHPVANNITPLLQHHDRSRFELFLYQDGGEDSHSAWFQQQADHWRQTRHLRDDQVSDLMQEDGLHLLVILAGHFDGNRLLLAAQHPAPLCISFHDGTTSGLAEMDYWLSDPVLHPADTSEQFTEKLWRLPVFYAYPPLEDAPAVAPPPALANGYVTFGSFNNPAKIQPQLLDLWQKILAAVPNSRLLLKYREFFADDRMVNAWRQRLVAAGMDPDRVSFAVGDTDNNHLAQYSQMDIALDPFPFTGATTTFQALWMGVPVISLAGERFIQRMAASILHHGGYGQGIATSPQEYVDKAVALASDLTGLQTLRNTLRPALSSSPMCNGQTYARTVEEAFLAMWQKCLPGS